MSSVTRDPLGPADRPLPRWRVWIAATDERWPGLRRRAGGFALALGLESALFLVLLTLGLSDGPDKKAVAPLTTVAFAPEPQPSPSDTPPEPEANTPASALPRSAPLPRPDQPAPAPRPLPIPMPTPAAIIPLSKNEIAAADVSKAKAVIRSDMQGPMGPPNTPSRGDSERVGSRPNGEPIYGARWYREPTDDEMRGYLSTANGSGWAIITCRTASGFRVEDCEFEDEYPSGVLIGRAALAAAWQFKVRPPQVGGRVLVGEWVRIKISLRRS